MSGRITQDERMDRTVVADKLNNLAGSFRSEGPAQVEVGNKSVELNPTQEVSYSIDVVETKRRFRGNRESIKIEISWKPES